MDPYLLGLSIFLLFTSPQASKAQSTSFNIDYYVNWGFNHAILLNQETKLQLKLDSTSGAGFESKSTYGSGFFHMRIKIPERNSIGVLTAFYLTSHSSNHDELDFEFFGGNGGSYVLQTNVFVKGQGGREQRIHLWFDPTKDFHSYKILWNEHQIVFYVDDIPIRVFKNNIEIGLGYPIQPMQIVGSIWNAEGWASGGKKIDWSQGPFTAAFQGFEVDGCKYEAQKCYSKIFWWNEEKYWNLNPREEKVYQDVKNKFLEYDYCNDKSRYPNQPPECKYNQ